MVSRLSWPTVRPALLAGAGLGIVVLSLALATGTSFGALWQGVVAGPLRHADAYHFGFTWRPGTVIATSASLLLWVGALRLRTRHGTMPVAAAGCIALLRWIVAGIFVAGSLVTPPATIGLVTSFWAATLPWWLIPLDSDRPAANAARAWLGLLAAWQFLHGYPVAGTQLGWGSFLWVALLVTALPETGAALTRWTARLPRRRLLAVGTVFAVAGPALALGSAFQLGRYYFTHAEPLDLPGAERLRVPPAIGSALRIVSRNAALQANLLFSYPGAFSFNRWTDLPPPTHQNVTHWFTLLPPAAREDIIARLKSERRTAVVAASGTGATLRPDGGTELESYLIDNYTAGFQVGPVALWLPSGQAFAVADGARLLREPDAEGARTVVLAEVLIPAGARIARIEVARFEGDDVVHASIHDWTAENTTAEAVSIYPNGVARGDPTPRPAAWPLTPEGLTQYRLSTTAPIPGGGLNRLWLRLIDPQGEQVGELRFVTLR